MNSSCPSQTIRNLSCNQIQARLKFVEKGHYILATYQAGNKIGISIMDGLRSNNMHDAFHLHTESFLFQWSRRLQASTSIKIKKMLPMGILNFCYLTSEIFFNFKVLTCNSNKQQAVEDRVLDFICPPNCLLISAGSTATSQPKIATMLASIVLLSAVGTASSLGKICLPLLQSTFKELNVRNVKFTSTVSQPPVRSTE